MTKPKQTLLERLRSDEQPTIKVSREALLIVVRRLDFGAHYSDADFGHAFDELRCAFNPDEIASGEIND